MEHPKEFKNEKELSEEYRVQILYIKNKMGISVKKLAKYIGLGEFAIYTKLRDKDPVPFSTYHYNLIISSLKRDIANLETISLYKD